MVPGTPCTGSSKEIGTVGPNLLHPRKAITNFDRTLPLSQSDLAQQITKDPYNFDFLSLGPEAHEPIWSAGFCSTFEISFWSSVWGRVSRQPISDSGWG